MPIAKPVPILAALPSLPALVAVSNFFNLAPFATAPSNFIPAPPPAIKPPISPIVPKPVSVGLNVACKSF